MRRIHLLSRTSGRRLRKLFFAPFICDFPCKMLIFVFSTMNVFLNNNFMNNVANVKMLSKSYGCGCKSN